MNLEATCLLVPTCRDVRHKGGVILAWALVLNYENLRRRWQGKGTSVKSEAVNAKAPSKGGAIRSSEKALVIGVERRDCVIRSNRIVNCANRRSFSEYLVLRSLQYCRFGQVACHRGFSLLFCALQEQSQGLKNYSNERSATQLPTFWRMCLMTSLCPASYLRHSFCRDRHSVREHVCGRGLMTASRQPAISICSVNFSRPISRSET